MKMALTLEMMDIGLDETNYIEIGTSRITKTVHTAFTDIYEFKAGPAKIEFVLGKSPKARFRVLRADDQVGVLEVQALYTRFSVECSHDDVYKFELFMGLEVELVSETTLLEALQELLANVQGNPNVLSSDSSVKAA